MAKSGQGQAKAKRRERPDHGVGSAEDPGLEDAVHSTEAAPANDEATERPAGEPDPTGGPPAGDEQHRAAAEENPAPAAPAFQAAEGLKTVAVEVPAFPAAQQLKFRADLGELSPKAARGARLLQGGYMQRGDTEKGRPVETVQGAVRRMLEQVAERYEGE